MNLDALIEAIPSYAKDLKLNFSSVVRQQTDLNEQQAWGTVVASAISSRNQELIMAALDEAVNHLSPEALDAAKGGGSHYGHEYIYARLPESAPQSRLCCAAPSRGNPCMRHIR